MVTTTVRPVADVKIDKTGPAQVDAGASFTYTLTVTNLGPSRATGIGVSDQPVGATATGVSASGGGFTSCSVNATNTATCTGGSLAKDAVATITLTVKAPNEGGSITNVATVSTNEDSTPANNASAVVTTVVGAVADVKIDKTGPAQVDAGASFTYTLTVTNLGPSRATGIGVSDQPVGATATGVSASGGGFTPCSVNATNTPTGTGGSLAKDAVATITPTVKAPNEGGSITNVATVSANEDSTPANNTSAMVTTTVRPVADVKIDKTGPAQVDAGASFTYTLTVTNLGPSRATGIGVSDQPVGATATGVSASGGGFTSCSVNATNTATCTGGSLAKDAVATITLTVKAPNEGGSITNVATVSANEDSTPANNTSAMVTTTVRPVADVKIDKTGPAQVDAGASFTYTLTVTNLGPSRATGIGVSDQPVGATATGVSASGGGFTSCSVNATNTATCTGGSLAKDAVATITLTVKAPNEGGSITNVATVSANEDSTPANNTSAMVTTTVRPVADVKIDKTGPAQVDAGASFTYTLTVTNLGPSRATGIGVSDQPVGAPATGVSASGGGFTSCSVNA